MQKTLYSLVTDIKKPFLQCLYISGQRASYFKGTVVPNNFFLYYFSYRDEYLWTHLKSEDY